MLNSTITQSRLDDEYADMRLAELKVAVASDIRPILRELEGVTMANAESLGKNLLVMLRQMQSALENHGIK